MHKCSFSAPLSPSLGSAFHFSPPRVCVFIPSLYFFLCPSLFVFLAETAAPGAREMNLAAIVFGSGRKSCERKQPRVIMMNVWHRDV